MRRGRFRNKRRLKENVRSETFRGERVFSETKSEKEKQREREGGKERERDGEGKGERKKVVRGTKKRMLVHLNKKR